MAYSVEKALFYRTFYKKYPCSLLILWSYEEEILVKVYKSLAKEVKRNSWEWDTYRGLWKAATYYLRTQEDTHKYKPVSVPRNELSGPKPLWLMYIVALWKQEVNAESEL